MVEVVFDAWLFDSLMPDLVGHDRKPASFIVYAYLYRRASDRTDWLVGASHQSIASATGLSRSAVQSALAHLQKRELVATSRAHATAVPMHQVLRPWVRMTRKRT